MKGDCVLVHFQFKFNSHKLHTRMEYFIICTSLNKSMFLKLYVTNMMQCNTFICGSKFNTEYMQFSCLSQSTGSLNIMLASYWL